VRFILFVYAEEQAQVWMRIWRLLYIMFMEFSKKLLCKENLNVWVGTFSFDFLDLNNIFHEF